MYATCENGPFDTLKKRMLRPAFEVWSLNFHSSIHSVETDDFVSE